MNEPLPTIRFATAPIDRDRRVGGTSHGNEVNTVSESLLTAVQVAELLAVPESWVREATRDGRLPHLRLGRYRRYQRSAIEAWLSDQSHAGRRDLQSRRG